MPEAFIWPCLKRLRGYNALNSLAVRCPVFSFTHYRPCYNGYHPRTLSAS
jgi:hypothetical protein